MTADRECMAIVRRIAKRMIRNVRDRAIEVHDLEQIGAVSVVATMRAYRPEMGSLPSVVARRAQNAMIDAAFPNRRRRGGQQVYVPGGEEIAAEQPATEWCADTSIDARRALDSLPERDRSVAMMLGIGHSMADVGGRLGISAQRVHAIATRVRMTSREAA